jgi:hypothetical protein
MFRLIIWLLLLILTTNMNESLFSFIYYEIIICVDSFGIEGLVFLVLNIVNDNSFIFLIIFIYVLNRFDLLSIFNCTFLLFYFKFSFLIQILFIRFLLFHSIVKFHSFELESYSFVL